MLECEEGSWLPSAEAAPLCAKAEDIVIRPTTVPKSNRCLIRAYPDIADYRAFYATLAMSSWYSLSCSVILTSTGQIEATLSAHMKAAVYTKAKAVKVLEIQDVEPLVPKSNEVVIRVHAASVNPLDWRMKSRRPGVDVA